MLELLGFDPEAEEQNAKDQKKAEEQLSEAAEKARKEMLRNPHSDRDVEEHNESGGDFGDNPDSDGEPSDEGKGKGKGNGKEGAGEEGEDTKPPTRRVEGGSGSGLSEHELESIESDTKHVEYKRDYGGYVQSDWKRAIIKDYAKKPATCKPCEKVVNYVHQGMFLGTHIRKLLQSRSQSRVQHGLKRGKLAGKNLYRATMTSTGGYQHKVFKKKQQDLWSMVQAV
jgi:hypothetical protein